MAYEYTGGQMLRGVILSFTAFIGAFFCQNTHAFRTAVFAPEIHQQSAFVLDQNRLFKNETSLEKLRPIWVHAGDSLSSGWGNKSSLRAQLEKAHTQALPEPKSLADISTHLPSIEHSWYAGRALDFGLLGFLQKQNQQWLVVSTALAGATLQNTASEDVLDLLEQVQEKNRVQLVTLSLGGNDVCDGLAPAQSRYEKLSRIKKQFSKNTKWFVWDLMNPVTAHESLTHEIQNLPDSIAKTRLQNYCAQAWQKAYCPSAVHAPQKALHIRQQIRTEYKKIFGDTLFQSEVILKSGHSLLDLISTDCFHPSKLAQSLLLQELKKEFSK